MKRYKMLVFLSILTLALNLFASHKQKLAIMEIEDNSKTYDKQILKNATEFLRSKLVDLNEYIIISSQRQDKVLEMKKQSYKKCYDKQCRIELGQALSADKILLTKITKFMGQFTISSEIIDLAKEATIKGASADFKKKGDLRNALFELFNKLSGKEYKKVKNNADKSFNELESGNMNLDNQYQKKYSDDEYSDNKTTNYDEGGFQTEPNNIYKNNLSKKATLIVDGKNSDIKIFIDNTFFGYVPVSGEIFPGEHTIKIKSHCFKTATKSFSVNPGEEKIFNTQTIHFVKKKAILEIRPRDFNNNYIKAKILINGKNAGFSPKTVKMPVCFKDIILIYKGVKYKEHPSLYTDQKNILSPILGNKNYQNLGNKNYSKQINHKYKNTKTNSTIEVFGFVHPETDFKGYYDFEKVKSLGGLGLGLTLFNVGIYLSFYSIDFEKTTRASVVDFNLYYIWKFVNIFDKIELYLKPTAGLSSLHHSDFDSATGFNFILPIGININFDDYYLFTELGYHYINLSAKKFTTTTAKTTDISSSGINIGFGIGMYY